jgi:DNA-binding transcriptional regulator YiaG
MPKSKPTSHAVVGASASALDALVRFLIERSIASHRAHEAGSAEAAYVGLLHHELNTSCSALAYSGTADSLLVPPVKVSETTIDALVQTQDAYAERSRAQSRHTDAVDEHQSMYLLEWQRRVKSHSERSHASMLSSLWKSGLSWRDIARLLKVSVAAVQKWRSGENMSSKNFARLRDFVAAYDMVAAHKPDVDVASWIDVPILTDVPVTPRELWIKGDPNTFFEYALGDMKSETALDIVDPNWRQRYREDGFETFIGADGNPGIRTKNR